MQSITVPGIDLDSLDPTVPATHDFFQYANGGWVKNNPIPPEYPRWGRFQELAELNQQRLRTILDELAAGTHPPGSNERKLADFYRTGLDEPSGATSVQAWFDRLGQWTDKAGLFDVVADWHRLGLTAFFQVGSTQDFADSTQVIGELGQGGLGLPDREYYLQDDGKIRDAYRVHIQRMSDLLGVPDMAVTVLRVETALARASKTKVALRDPADNYHRMSRTELAALTPSFNWTAYLDRIAVPASAPLTVGQPEFLQALEVVLAETPVEDLRTYLRWHLVDGVAPFLSAAFVDEDFHFSGTVLTGAEKLRERWKRVVSQTDNALGEALGQVYVARHFPPHAKARVLAMVENIKAALRDDLAQLSWMGDETRQQAIAKMDAFTSKIGYPDQWRDYSKLDIRTDSYVENVLRAHQFAFDRDIHKIGRPVDKHEWYMSPATVNAYYNPLMNEIVFPAALLQPPFFNAESDDAANYGAIGAVIGHEMTHGFDDQGCKFDAQGNLKNWWTDGDLLRFEARAQAIVRQFNGYEVEPGLHINGELVQGEAIADLGGLTLAWAAFQRAGEGHAAAGFTAAQRFFLGFAQIWASSMRPEYVRFQILNDPHPNPRYRVMGTLANMKAFSVAFNCPPDSPMVLADAERTDIW